MGHQLGSDAVRRVDEWFLKIGPGPGKRKCGVCRLEVFDPDDYLLIEYLSDDLRLREFNYTHLHKSCLQKWDRRTDSIELIRSALSSGVLKGSYFYKLIEDLQSAT
jgi:hypothetical protein